jgi:hypothetical protein
MRAPAHLALIALLAVGVPSMAQQLEPEQDGLLESAREAALRYSDSLPDFICTEVVRRTQDPQGNGRWRSIDTLTIKLTYFGHQEDYKLMLVNGKPTTLDYLHAGGALSTGEFGTRLLSLFEPRSHAEFHWKGWTTIRKRRAARFSYRVTRENSIFRIQYGAVADDSNSIVVPYHGEVFVDEQTHMVLRMTQQGEVPLGFPITFSESIVDYEFAEVGGKPYLLPAAAHVKTSSGRFAAENSVEFRDYRKFQTETNISFESAKP